MLSKKQRALSLFQRKQKIDEDGTTSDAHSACGIRMRNNSVQSEHKTEVDVLGQALRSYSRGQKINETDKRLLCGIYEGKVEETSDDSKEDGWCPSQKTAKMPKLDNKSHCSLESNPIDDLFKASVPKLRTSTKIPETDIGVNII